MLKKRKHRSQVPPRVGVVLHSRGISYLLTSLLPLSLPCSSWSFRVIKAEYGKGRTSSNVRIPEGWRRTYRRYDEAEGSELDGNSDLFCAYLLKYAPTHVPCVVRTM